MNNLKEYLDNLFMGLPETPAVLRAKAELLEMMEDKYEELMNDGKSETEAFGTVVSEFGNLEELAEELGISDQLNKAKTENAKEVETVSSNKNANVDTEEPAEIWDEPKMSEFLKLMWTHAKMMAFAIVLFIATPGLISMLEDIGEAAGANGVVLGGLSTLLFFVLVATGVVLCVHSGHIFKTFGYNKKRRVGLDVQAAELLKAEREVQDDKLYKMRILGILLLVFSVVPSSIFNPSNAVLSAIVDVSFLFMVAAGVYTLVVRGSVMNRYKEFGKAKLYNEAKTSEISASYFVEPKPKKLSGTGLALIIISVVLVVGIVITTICAAIFGAVKNVGSWAKENMESETEFDVEKMSKFGDYTVDDIDNIVVDSDAINVKFLPSDDDQLHVWFAGSGLTPKVEKKGKDLVIDVDHGGVNVHLDFEEIFSDSVGVVYVRVPKQAELLNYKYDLDAGKVVMDGITADEVSIDTDASQITLKNLTANEVTVKEDAGAVKMENCEIEKFKANVDATAIKATSTSFESVDIEADAGAVDLETVEGSDCYGFDVKSDFAAIKIGGASMVGNYSADAKDTSKGDRFMKIKADAASISVK